MQRLRSFMTELTSQLEEAGDWMYRGGPTGYRGGGGDSDGHASGGGGAVAQADNNTGGVTPVRDAGGGGGAVPDAEAAPEPEAQAQAEAQLPVQLPDAQTEETQLPAGDGGAHAEPWPTCRRFGCRYLRHRQNGFAGFWCGRCRDGIRWGHGPQCQKIPWRPSADDESPFGPGGLTATCAPQ